MPIYEFECKKCQTAFQEMCTFDESHHLSCPQCKSRRINRCFSSGVSVIFTNPIGTSKADNFGYVAKANMERAKQESAAARAKTPRSPYNSIDDTRRGMNYVV